MPERDSKTENILLQEISKKLTELTAISGLSKISDKKEDKIRYLVGFGLSNADISRLTGFPEGTVAPLRAALSKGAKGKGA